MTCVRVCVYDQQTFCFAARLRNCCRKADLCPELVIRSVTVDYCAMTPKNNQVWKGWAPLDEFLVTFLRLPCDHFFRPTQERNIVYSCSHQFLLSCNGGLFNKLQDLFVLICKIHDSSSVKNITPEIHSATERCHHSHFFSPGAFKAKGETNVTQQTSCVRFVCFLNKPRISSRMRCVHLVGLCRITRSG